MRVEKFQCTYEQADYMEIRTSGAEGVLFSNHTSNGEEVSINISMYDLDTLIAFVKGHKKRVADSEIANTKV